MDPSSSMLPIQELMKESSMSFQKMERQTFIIMSSMTVSSVRYQSSLPLNSSRAMTSMTRWPLSRRIASASCKEYYYECRVMSHVHIPRLGIEAIEVILQYQNCDISYVVPTEQGVFIFPIETIRYGKILFGCKITDEMTIVDVCNILYHTRKFNDAYLIKRKSIGKGFEDVAIITIFFGTQK